MGTTMATETVDRVATAREELAALHRAHLERQGERARLPDLMRQALADGDDAGYRAAYARSRELAYEGADEGANLAGDLRRARLEVEVLEEDLSATVADEARLRSELTAVGRERDGIAARAEAEYAAAAARWQEAFSRTQELTRLNTEARVRRNRLEHHARTAG